MPARDAGPKAHRKLVAPSTVDATDEARAKTQPPATAPLSEDIDNRERNDGVKFGGFIAVIESHTFIGECIRRSVQSAFTLPVLTYSTAAELEQQNLLTAAQLVIFSLSEDNMEVSVKDLRDLSTRAPRIPIIVLAFNNDRQLALNAISHGVKGYIPVTMGFEITIAAVRFVLAGGTYAPTDFLLWTNPPRNVLSQPSGTGLLTGRELAVTRAIQKGKSNKVIAYELNMSESTVKVHVRNIMRKLKAMNRTDVAIKTQTTLSAESERITTRPFKAP